MEFDGKHKIERGPVSSNRDEPSTLIKQPNEHPN